MLRCFQANIKIRKKNVFPLVNLHEVNKFLESLKLLKLTQKIENWSKLITKGLK